MPPSGDGRFRLARRISGVAAAAMLRPVTTTTSWPSISTLPPSTAATPAAPAPSATRPWRANSHRIACAHLVVVDGEQAGPGCEHPGRHRARLEVRRQPVGDRVADGLRTTRPAAIGGRDRAGLARLDAGELDTSGRDRAHRARPESSPPPPTGATTVSSAAALAVQLAADRRLSCDDHRVVVGRDERRPRRQRRDSRAYFSAIS